MSNFAGVTFTKQAVSPSDDAIVRRALLSDGILTGCAFTYSGSTLTMAAGHLMICGRQIKHPASQNWAVVDATSGFARLVLTIDMTRTATKDTFDQVVDSIEYASAVDGFVNLEQSDINGSGTRYQIAACVVSLGAGGITGIVSQLERAEAGGSGGLNFSVVGGETQPSGPKENMIWVNTSDPVAHWILDTNIPEDPGENDVWIKVGKTSPVSFNAVKKNVIAVYPISAMQFVGGTWVERAASCYQNGEWRRFWSGQLYTPGEEWTDITGGWTGRGAKSTSSSYVDAVAPTISRGEASLIAETSGGSMLYTGKRINLTDFNTLTFRGVFERTGTSVHNLIAACWEKLGTYYYSGDGAPAAYTSMSDKTATELVVDVSGLSGEYYVGLGIYDSRQVITEVFLSV